MSCNDLGFAVSSYRQEVRHHGRAAVVPWAALGVRMHLDALIICQLVLIASEQGSVGVLSDPKYSINIDNEGLIVRLSGFGFRPVGGHYPLPEVRV